MKKNTITHHNKICEHTQLLYASVNINNCYASTVFPRIEAGISISFVGFLTRPLFRGGLYSRKYGTCITHSAIEDAVKEEFQVPLEQSLAQTSGYLWQSVEQGLQQRQVLAIVSVTNSLCHSR